MATTSKKTFVITKANGEEVEVKGTHAEEESDRAQVKVYDGDDIVASFRGYTSFYVDGSKS